MNTKQDSIHSLNDNILNSSILESLINSKLSSIDEAEKESEMAGSLRNNLSPINANKNQRVSKFSGMATNVINNTNILSTQNLDSSPKNLLIQENNMLENFNKQLITSKINLNRVQSNILLPNLLNIISINDEGHETMNDELETTIVLDFNDLAPVKSQLPPLSLAKMLNQEEFSVVLTNENISNDDDELDFSLNYIINQMEVCDSNAENSFKLNDFLEERKELNIDNNLDLNGYGMNMLDNHDNAIIEISSFLGNSDDSSKINLISQKISYKNMFTHFLKQTFSRHFLKRKEVKTFILFYISLFNSFYVPLNLIFDSFNYPTDIMIVEILNVLYLAYLFLKKSIKYQRALKRRNDINMGQSFSTGKLTRDDENAIILQLKTKNEVFLTLFYEFLYVIPFPLIISKIEPNNRIFYILIIFRLINVKYIIRGIHYLKEKNSVFGSSLQILILSIVFIHTFACILIAIALSEPDFNQSFLRRMPAPEYSFDKNTRESLDISDKDIYTHCLYWVYATVSKSGVMEMQVVSLGERVFSIVVMTVGGLFYIFVFGNMVSLVEDLTPKMKSILEKQEKKVLKFVRNLNLKGLERKVENYFNHLWKSDKGFNENELLCNLPSSLKVDLQKCQYQTIFRKSKFFSHGKLIPRADSSLIYSLFKFLQSEIFIPEDVIIIAGEYCSKVYFILEGRIELISFNFKNKILLQSGDFFGGILGNERQPGYVKALTYCKIGSLDQETFNIMKERFPLWNDKMINQMKGHKGTLLRDLSFFKDDLIESIKGFEDKVIDEKIIEHYYPMYLKFEKDVNEEKKTEKIIKNEIKIMISSRKTPRTDTHDPLLPISSKRQNIVNLMSQSTFY